MSQTPPKEKTTIVTTDPQFQLAEILTDPTRLAEIYEGHEGLDYRLAATTFIRENKVDAIILRLRANKLRASLFRPAWMQRSKEENQYLNLETNVRLNLSRSVDGAFLETMMRPRMQSQIREYEAKKKHRFLSLGGGD